MNNKPSISENLKSSLIIISLILFTLLNLINIVLIPVSIINYFVIISITLLLIGSNYNLTEAIYYKKINEGVKREQVFLFIMYKLVLLIILIIYTIKQDSLGSIYVYNGINLLHLFILLGIIDNILIFWLIKIVPIIVLKRNIDIENIPFNNLKNVYIFILNNLPYVLLIITIVSKIQ